MDICVLTPRRPPPLRRRSSSCGCNASRRFVFLAGSSSTCKRFAVHRLNASQLPVLLPDLPPSFWRVFEGPKDTNGGVAQSDIAGTGLLARYGGIFMDADFLVRSSLMPIASHLATHELVSYAVAGQGCERGIFSRNFLAARPGSAIMSEAWRTMRADLSRRCRARWRCQLPWAYAREVLLCNLAGPVTAPVTGR